MSTNEPKFSLTRSLERSIDPQGKWRWTISAGGVVAASGFADRITAATRATDQALPEARARIEANQMLVALEEASRRLEAERERAASALGLSVEEYPLRLLEDESLPDTTDKLATSNISKVELVRLLRQAQAERDRYQAEALRYESELQRAMIRLHTIEDEGRAG